MSRRPTSRFGTGLLATALLAAACSAETTTSDAPTDINSGPTNAPTTTEYRDAKLRQFQRQMNEPRPVENSAMPPRHLDAERFPTALVERTDILPGGPPPDGIPSIDAPRFDAVDDVGFLDDREAVILLELDEGVRVYPIQIMMWHEIVNDDIDGRPVTVAYCPLCNSAVAFDRATDSGVLDFGVTGYLYQSGMVMYDRQTETIWTHFDGRAVVGTLAGAQLDRLPAQTVSWATAREAHPDALVLNRDTGTTKPYGRNPYNAYDQLDAPLSSWLTAEIPDTLPPMTRVIGVRTDGGDVAIPTATVAERTVAHLTIGDDDVVVFWQPGTNSPLQAREVADGDDIGSTGAFTPTAGGRDLTFAAVDGRIVDTETGTTWSILGHGLDGELAGERLEPVDHLDTFWFAWSANHPGTNLVR